MALTMSRVDRLNRTIDLAGRFPGVTVTAVAVALLPKYGSPTAATVWTAATYAAGAATVLLAGPDADPAGALAVPASGDLWVRVTSSPEVDAEKVERVTVLDGGVVVTPPGAALDAAVFAVLNDPASATFAKVEALIAARAGFGGLATP